jgi:pilus assembly protein CpaB
MKSKSFMLMVLSMGFGLIAAIGISQVMGSKANTAPPVKMGPVLVASSHLNIKAQLSEENCSIENWPVNLIPEGAATDLEEVKGKVITARARKGQVLHSMDIKHRNEIVELAIPPGHKVINIKVPPEDAMSGLLSPGAKVDIIGVFPVRDRNGNGTNRSETRTFLKAIRVFNVNGNTTDAQHREGSKNSGSAIVGVIVTERQAEKIVLVKKEGDIRLALRGEADETEPTDVDDPFFKDLEKDDQLDDEPVAKSGLPETANTMVIYHGGTEERKSYFDKDDNLIHSTTTSSESGGDMYGPYKGPPSSESGRPTGEPRDYEDSEESGEINPGREEDQYQGE